MIINIYGNDTKDGKLRKTKGIKYISKYLPNIDANKQGNIVNKIPEPWEIFSPERLIAKSENENQER